MIKRGFTHFDSSGGAVMVDVSGKKASIRTAVAKGVITMSAGTFAAILGGTAAKGDVLGVARLAGIMAAKQTSGLIPLCHSLTIDSCTVDFSPDEAGSRIEAVCRVKLSGRTGAEMEALTGASVALLTVYDMCKALDRAMVIGNIRLCEKSGGKSGHFKREERPEGGHAG
jgi:cyclic pyranopterin phosphate synthase